MATEPIPENKPWYFSKTLYGVVIAAVALVLGWLGKPDLAEGVQGETATVGQIVEQIAVVVGLVLAAWGRIVSNTKLTK